MQGGQLASRLNDFILLYWESHLNQRDENFEGILRKLGRMKRIKYMIAQPEQHTGRLVN